MLTRILERFAKLFEIKKFEKRMELKGGGRGWNELVIRANTKWSFKYLSLDRIPRCKITVFPM